MVFGHAVTKMWVIIACLMKGVAPSIHLERTCGDGGGGRGEVRWWWGGGGGGARIYTQTYVVELSPVLDRTCGLGKAHTPISLHVSLV